MQSLIDTDIKNLRKKSIRKYLILGVEKNIVYMVK